MAGAPPRPLKRRAVRRAIARPTELRDTLQDRFELRARQLTAGIGVLE
jgi:hypothetical protein